MEQVDRATVSKLIMELQTNIQGIMIGLDDLADLIYEQGSGQDQENLCMMDRKLFQVLRITRHLNILSGDSWFVPQENDILKLCEDLVFDCNNLTRMLGITVTLEREGHIPHAKFDPALVQDALLCLVSNSVAACENGGSIVVRLAVQGRTITISVIDDGRGLPEKKNENPLLAVPGEGVGLGLSVVRHVAELHNGTFSIENGPQGGSIARFSLPALPAQSETILATPTISGMEYDLSGGFSPALVELSHLLPNGCFDPQLLM